MSTRVEYKIGEDVLEIIRQSIYDGWRDTGIDFTVPNPKPRYLYIRTGLAGMMQVDSAIKTMAVISGLVAEGMELRNVPNRSIDENEVPFTSYPIPFLANIRFVIDITMDPVEASSTTNPFTNGWRLSSYNYIISEGDNILVEIICTGNQQY